MGILKTAVKTVTLPVRTVGKTSLWLVTDNSKKKHKKQMAKERQRTSEVKKAASEKIKALKDKYSSKPAVKKPVKKDAPKNKPVKKDAPKNKPVKKAPKK